MQMVHSRSFPHYFFSLFRGSIYPFFFLLYQNLDEKLDEQQSVLPKTYEVSIERFRGHKTVRCFFTPFLPTLSWFFDYLLFYYGFSIVVLLGVYIFDYSFTWCLHFRLWFYLMFTVLGFVVLLVYFLGF